MAKYTHTKEDIMNVVEAIIYTYASYGFTDYAVAVRETEKDIHNGDIELETDYPDVFKDESGNAIEELVYTVADPIALTACHALEDNCTKLINEASTKAHKASESSGKKNPDNPNNPHPQVGLPSLFPEKPNNPGEEEEELTPMDKLEEEIYDKQYNYIKNKFGKDAANSANYGWGASASDEYISIATKVYQHGVLTSEGTLSSGEITHNFEKF